jgi:3-oxoacyl-[acyl-carrier protein] reductase
MNIQLQDKFALVGGSTQGIGKAIAMQLAACGATVTVMARNEAKLKQVVTELPAYLGQKHQYLVADFANFAQFRKVITDFFRHNSIDILVNNTNGPAAGTALEKGPEDYQAAFDLLFQTVCHTTLEALPGMRKQRFGRIINVSSVSVKEPIQHLSLSNTIRTSLISWSKTLSREVAADHITVNNILTGYFDTERLNSLMQLQAQQKNIDFEMFKQQTADTVPMKRFGKPEEYGFLVAFLASDYASYITGTSIPIDGGRLISL